MARSSLLLDLVRAGARGDQALFRKALEALVTEERAKQHHVLADRLAAHLHTEGARGNGPVAPAIRGATGQPPICTTKSRQNGGWTTSCFRTR